MMTTIRRTAGMGRNMGGKERIASVIGGAALVAWGLKRRSRGGYAMAALGGGLLQRGTTGHCYMYQSLGVNRSRQARHGNVSLPYELGVRIDEVITVNKPPEECYNFWRDMPNLGRIMREVVSVTQTGEKRTHWVVRGPGGKTYEWDAEIIHEEADRLIGWRSLPGSKVEIAGSVYFKPAPGGRGTVVRVELQYNPPGGYLGAALAKLIRDPAQQVREDLQRFKQVMEIGEIVTAAGQSTGPRTRTAEVIGKLNPARDEASWRDRCVDESSMESFPASDPPSWTPAALR